MEKSKEAIEIQKLISDEVCMGTYGLVELEVRKLDEQIRDLKEQVKTLNIDDVSNQRELLIAYEKGHYTEQEWVLAKDQCIKDINIHLAIYSC